MEINIKTLIKNSGILVVSNASLKVISFLLLPLYTSALAPEVYGVTDTVLNLSALIYLVFNSSYLFVLLFVCFVVVCGSSKRELVH